MLEKEWGWKKPIAVGAIAVAGTILASELVSEYFLGTSETRRTINRLLCEICENRDSHMESRSVQSRPVDEGQKAQSTAEFIDDVDQVLDEPPKNLENRKAYRSNGNLRLLRGSDETP